MRKLVKTKDRYLTFWGFAKKMKKVFTPPQISFWGLMRINESLGLTYLGKPHPKRSFGVWALTRTKWMMHFYQNNILHCWSFPKEFKQYSGYENCPNKQTRNYAAHTVPWIAFWTLMRNHWSKSAIIPSHLDRIYCGIGQWITGPVHWHQVLLTHFNLCFGVGEKTQNFYWISLSNQYISKQWS